MKGAHGKLLRVNLTEMRTESFHVEPDMWRKWLGGRGLGARLLTDFTSPGMDPFSPNAPLFIVCSPLMGTLTPGTNKLAAVFKSPLTGTVFVSMCGGHLGPAIRYAGWDGIIIEGAAEKPVMLYVGEKGADLPDASGLWGKEVSLAADKLAEQWPGDGIEWAVIGPAGERGVKFASVHSGRGREFGRGGMGALMGSKRLKAVVVSGRGGPPVADRRKLEELARAAWVRMMAEPKARVRRRWGTLELVATVNELGFWPVHNYRRGHFEKAGDIDANAYENTVLVAHRSCHSCPIACGKIGVFRTPEGAEYEIEGPEFESLSMLGPNIGLDNFTDIAYATRLCDELGVDTISMGHVIGVVTEAAERGLLPADMARELEPGFGKSEAAFGLIRRCALAEDEIGRLLGSGPAELAGKLGHPELAMTTKGLGLAAYDPRGIKGLALNYATAAEGASHMRGPTMGPEISGGKRLEEKDKARLVIDCQVSMAVADSVGLCSTCRLGMEPERIAEFLTAVTGEEFTGEELEERGREILTLERRYNLREGFTRKDDSLPRRFLEEPMPDGHSAGSIVNLDEMLAEYYRLMGWDENGVPPD